MVKPTEDQSLAELIVSLAGRIPALVRDELTLLQSQLAFVLGRVQTASALLVVALALVISTVMLLVAAAVSGLAVFFYRWVLSRRRPSHWLPRVPPSPLRSWLASCCSSSAANSSQRSAPWSRGMAR